MEKHYDADSRELIKGNYFLDNGKTQIYFTGEYNKENGFAKIINQNGMKQSLPLCLTKILKRVEN